MRLQFHSSTHGKPRHRPLAALLPLFRSCRSAPTTLSGRRGVRRRRSAAALRSELGQSAPASRLARPLRSGSCAAPTALRKPSTVDPLHRDAEPSRSMGFDTDRRLEAAERGAPDVALPSERRCVRPPAPGPFDRVNPRCLIASPSPVHRRRRRAKPSPAFGARRLGPRNIPATPPLGLAWHFSDRLTRCPISTPPVRHADLGTATRPRGPVLRARCSRRVTLPKMPAHRRPRRRDGGVQRVRKRAGRRRSALGVVSFTSTRPGNDHLQKICGVAAVRDFDSTGGSSGPFSFSPGCRRRTGGNAGST